MSIFSLAFFIFLSHGWFDMAIEIYNTPWYSKGIFFSIFKYPALIVFFSIALGCIYFTLLMIRFFLVEFYKYIFRKSE